MLVGWVAGWRGMRSNTAFVPTRHAGLFESTLQQQVVITHDPVNPLHIDRRQRMGFTFPTQ